MKKIITLTVLVILGLIATVQAQHNHEKCLAEIMFQEAAAQDPQVLRNRENLEIFTENYVKNYLSSYRGAMVNKVIPVVVHVIHYGGSENISKAQIEDQIRILNEDFQRLNADTVNTPAVFQPLSANTGIEFKLAQLDPNGNCTDGITRTYSPLTVNARNNVKSLIRWPRDKYLNMWIVSSIANTNNSPGSVIGFAQFPGGADSTDGVVIKHDFMGSIGTAAQQNGMGRTSTHEVGHWLNLRHIWGDATCGNDNVADTPTQYEANLSICPAWPYVSACSGSAPNGDMFTNYMDYTNGNCQNQFSVGQSARMNATLASSVSGRSNLWSANNLVATGTNGVPTVLCAPVADFIPRPAMICEGSSVNFGDFSWGGDATSRTWTFPGGVPATDTSANPTVVYPTAGIYDVTLTVTNSAGTNSKTIPGRVIVVNSTNTTGVVPFVEGFETGSWPFNEYYTINANGGNTWAINSSAAFTGTKSLYINNFTNNDKGPDEFITPAFNLTNVTNTTLTFDLACALRDTTTDRLAVYYSTNCGQTWTVRYSRQGLALQTTTGFVGANFVPNASQWRNETASFATTAVSTKPNVRFRFEFNHDTGNNIYIDNINLNGTVASVDEINAEYAGVNIYPNPSKSNTYVDFSMVAEGRVQIEVMDAQGRQVSSFVDQLPAGDHQYQMNNSLETGVYFVRLSFGNSSVTKKVVIR